MPDRRRNDLEVAALELYPELAGLRARIVDAGFPEVLMSGSGSTLFLVADDEAGAAEIERALGFLQQEGVRLVRTGSADPRDQELCEVRWPSAARRGNQGG